MPSMLPTLKLSDHSIARALKERFAAFQEASKLKMAHSSDLTFTTTAARISSN